MKQPAAPLASGRIVAITLDHEGEHPLLNIAGTGWVKVEGKAVIIDATGTFIAPFTLFTNRTAFLDMQLDVSAGEAESKTEQTIDGQTVQVVFEVKQGQLQ